MAAFQLDKPNAKWLGVCAGIANRLNVDPIVIRVLTVAAALCSSVLPVLVLYLILALVVDGR